MCGRFALTATPDELADAFPWLTINLDRQGLPPRYNIAPSQPIAIITNTSPARLDYVNWGLIPFWAKDPKIGYKMINARAETLAEKPSFKAAYKYRRCLIPANGFYEWQPKPESKNKTPYYIRMRDTQPFAFAGLWERWQSPDGSEILSAAIITTEPNDLIRPIHNRMPVIVPPEKQQTWLTPGEMRPVVLQTLLITYPPEEMEAYPVSTFVNSPANDNPACQMPASTP